MYHLKLKKGMSYTGVVHATKKMPDVYVEDKQTADAAVASGYFTLIGMTTPTEERDVAEGYLEKEQLESMTVEELKRFASTYDVDISACKVKADYVNAIFDAHVIIEVEGVNKIYYGEGSETMIALQSE